jgi:hypothetical protein
MSHEPKIVDSPPNDTFVCFAGFRRIAEGSLIEVSKAARTWLHAYPTETTLTFDRHSGAVVDLNLSGSQADLAARYSKQIVVSAKRGRPKLGVVAREVTLLPRHWDWLGQQSGGASVTLRRLVDAARKERSGAEFEREAIAAAYKFMSAIGGDMPLFEDASRALFAKQFEKLDKCLTGWPTDIRNEVARWLEPLRQASKL